MTKQEFLSITSKIEQTFEDEFKAEYNSPEYLWDNLLSKHFSEETFKCPCCGSDKTYRTDAIHCTLCAVTTEI